MIPTLIIFIVALLLNEWRVQRERQAWIDERRALLNRIQAPEVAMSIESLPEPPEKPYVGFEDDAAWNELQRASR